MAVIALGVLLMHGLVQDPSHSEHSDGHATSDGADAAHPFGGCCLWVIVGAVGAGVVLAFGVVRRRAAWSRSHHAWTHAVRAAVTASVGRAPPAMRSLAMLGVSRR